MQETLRISIISVLFTAILINAQQIWKDDPNKDQVPLPYLTHIKHLPPSEAVITIDGFDNFDMGVDFSEPHISSNPLNPLQYFNAWNINASHYTMNGYDWLTKSPNFSNTMWGDPVTAYDSIGNLFYQNMYGSSSTISGALVIRSTDNGNTWGASVIGVAGADKNWIAADQTAGPFANYVYCTMTASSSGGNFYRSTNNGASFSLIRNFTPHSLPGMMVAVGPNVLNGNNVSGGAVYVVTNSNLAYASTYTFFVSNDGGATFAQKSSQNFAGYVGTYTGGRNSVQNMRTRPYPMIAADNSYGPYRGRLYLVYASNTPAGSGNKPDIFSRYSTDQGATWSSAVVVNDDPNTTANHQWMPAIWCDKQTGRFFVQWMDTRDTPTSDSAFIYASYSDNGGITFAPNQRISNKKMKINCTTCGGSGTPMYLGDYNAVTSNAVTSMLVWGDFRNGQFGSYSGYFPDFAVTVAPTAVSLMNNDSAAANLNIPAVKLYSSTVRFSALVTNPPASGSISVSFPNGNMMSSYPGTLPVKIYTSGSVPSGSYTLSVSGAGPNGTPFHKRNITVNVTSNVICNNISIAADWNMLSVPRIASNMTPTALFPNLNSLAYGYNNGYFGADTLKPGIGYWMRFPSAHTVSICGSSPALSSINIKTGWNLIGGNERTISPNSISTVPAGILISPFYGYAGGYTATDSIYAGKGFWIKSSQDGVLNLPLTDARGNYSFDAKKISDNTAKIIFTDNLNHTCTLFLSKTLNPEIDYELPPLPPAGLFDARFSSSRSTELHNGAEKYITINSDSYPIRIRAEGIDIKLTDNINSKLLNADLRSGDEITLNNSAVKTLRLTANENVIGYQLAQNYPNPYNPATSITFSIPSDKHVSLKLYDVLGNEVATLIDDFQKAGVHTVSFNASRLSNGTYFYEMRSDDFRMVRKMILMK